MGPRYMAVDPVGSSDVLRAQCTSALVYDLMVVVELRHLYFVLFVFVNSVLFGG
jgi:hypothetical protein